MVEAVAKMPLSRVSDRMLSTVSLVTSTSLPPDDRVLLGQREQQAETRAVEILESAQVDDVPSAART